MRRCAAAGPSCHRAFDEATAILAGDALQPLAFEVLARPDYGADAEQRGELVAGPGACRRVARHVRRPDARPDGREQAWSLADISAMQRLKTGALIRYACEAGAILGRAPADAAAALGAYAEDLGLAFQIQDDLLDRGGEGVATGKDAGRDDQVGKATFVGVAGRGRGAADAGRAARRARWPP